jgi:hypothetical protein
MQQVRRAGTGTLHLLTGVVTGYWALRLMLLPINGGPQSPWPSIMLGASILLLVAAVHAVIPRVRGVWLVLLAPAIPLVLCAVLFQSVAERCWFFALAMALSMWIIQAIASARKRAGLVFLIASLILAASWVPLSVNTLRLYFAPATSSSDPMTLVLALAPWVLIFATVVAGVVACKSPASDGAGSGGVFGHRAEHIRGTQ